MRSSIADYATALYESVAADPSQSKAITVHFVAMLRKNKQDRFLPQILARLTEIEAEKQNEIIVEAVTAQPLSSEQQAQLVKQLGQKLGKTVILKAITDENLIGGIKLFIGDTTIDNSIAQTVNRLATSLQKG